MEDAFKFITLKEIENAHNLAFTNNGIELINKWLDNEPDFSVWLEGFTNAMISEHITPHLPENVSQESLENIIRDCRDHIALGCFFTKHIFDARADAEFRGALKDV